MQGKRKQKSVMEPQIVIECYLEKIYTLVDQSSRY